MVVKNGIIIADEIAENLNQFQIEQALSMPDQASADRYVSEMLTSGHFEPVTQAAPAPEAPAEEVVESATEESPKLSKFSQVFDTIKRLLPDGDLYEKGRAVVVFLTVVSLAYISYHYIELNTGRNAVPKNLLPAYDRMVREESAARIRFDAAKACHKLRSVGGSCEIK